MFLVPLTKFNLLVKIYGAASNLSCLLVFTSVNKNFHNPLAFLNLTAHRDLHLKRGGAHTSVSFYGCMKCTNLKYMVCG